MVPMLLVIRLYCKRFVIVSDGDEPLLSGTGEVSKDCGEDVLVNWAQVLRR